MVNELGLLTITLWLGMEKEAIDPDNSVTKRYK
jgi:hypothetical protein